MVHPSTILSAFRTLGLACFAALRARFLVTLAPAIVPVRTVHVPRRVSR